MPFRILKAREMSFFFFKTDTCQHFQKVFILLFLWLFGGLVAKLCPILVTPWAVVCQAPLFLGFSRQEYWNGFPLPSPGDFPDPGIKLGSPALQADSLLTEL